VDEYLNKVLVIGYVWPEPNSSAAGSHIMSIMRLFLSQGFSVEFATPCALSEHMIDLKAEGISSKSIELNCDSFDEYIKELNPSIVMFDRFMMEEQFGWRVEKNCPQAMRILDTEDMQCLRNARHQAVKQDREMELKDLYSDLAKREIAAIYRSDLSLIISSYEMQLLQEQFQIPAAQIYHLPFMLDLNALPANTPSYEQRKNFIMIGNFRHAPNWDSVLQMQQLWPQIRQQLKARGVVDAELHIYGSYPPPKATALNNPKSGFLVKGWADNAYEVMQQARVCLAPLRFGAGIKGKLLDAMVCGTPSATTNVGSEGMTNGQEWPGVVARNDQEFIEQAVKLYCDREFWQHKQKQTSPLLKTIYNGSLSGPQLIDRILALKENLDHRRLQNFTGAMLNHHSMKSTQYMSQWIEEKNKTLSS